RSAMSLLETARMTFRRPGKRALFVAEQFTLNQALRQRRGINRDERTVPTGTAIVNLTGDQFFAGSALPAY
ncbi:MAG TPA: hypothetical protein VNH18_26060, partial [Bryobacteraceae bacterium]|nr:hypothetical protein [Bryobacteraceae bacterium]